VAIRYHNQSVVDVGRVSHSSTCLVDETNRIQIDGGQQYIDMMARAMPPYRQRGPPFHSIKEELDWQYEQLQRAIRKARGLPENPDTEILSEMLYQLHLLASIHSEVPVLNSVFLSAPSLPNLSYEDFNAAFPFANLTQGHGYRQGYEYRSYGQVQSAFAGMGYGLCKHWADVQKCIDEEGGFPYKSVLAIGYMDDTLDISVAWGETAYDLWTDVTASYPEFGYNGTSHPDSFWHDIKLRITTVARASRTKPDTLILLGERATEKKFLDTVWEALHELEIPELYEQLQVPGFDPTRISARGGAEFAKRAQGGPRGCVEGDWCKNRRKGEDGMAQLAEGKEGGFSNDRDGPLQDIPPLDMETVEEPLSTHPEQELFKLELA
jgi:hypothetical protein